MGRLLLVLTPLPAWLTACVAAPPPVARVEYTDYIRVDGREVDTLQEAAAQVEDGGTIEFCGEYPGPVDIEGHEREVHAVSVVGCDRDHAIIRGDETSNGVWFDEETLVLERLTITGATEVCWEEHCDPDNCPEESEVWTECRYGAVDTHWNLRLTDVAVEAARTQLDLGCAVLVGNPINAETAHYREPDAVEIERTVIRRNGGRGNPGLAAVCATSDILVLESVSWGEGDDENVGCDLAFGYLMYDFSPETAFLACTREDGCPGVEPSDCFE